MCGIVGYIGKGDAKTVVLQGLEKLEYRGYDSAGIAVIKDSKIMIEKKKGKLKNLENHLENLDLESHIGIGHTRWATHGEPSDRNSHPHFTEDMSIAVVHNGIIENYATLKSELIQKGYNFTSDTDTEVVAHLIHSIYEGDLFSALTKALKLLRGSYALGVIHKDFPNEIICTRKDSPLVIGLGENENLIASDVPAILKYTKNVYFLEDGDIARLTADNVEIFDKTLVPVEREIKVIEWDYEQATKGGFPHFMIKEIFEQPKSIEETLNRRIHDGIIDFSDVLTEDEIKKFNMIHIVACGTAYHAGLQGQYALREISGVNSLVEIASEYRYMNPFVDENTLAIFVSQSGETLDTLAALKEAKARGAKTIAITNVVGSTISREAHKTIYTMAGPEIAVASTKAYTTQVIILQLLSIYLAEKKGRISKEKASDFIKELYSVSEKIKTTLDNVDIIKDVAEFMKDKHNGFYIGRGVDFATALEGSLKMKEITYIHTEAFPAGELKHGSIALIEPGTPVVVVAMQTNLLEKTISNIKELKARGAHIVTVARNSCLEAKEVSDEFIGVGEIDDVFSVLLAVIPLQLLSYFTSIKKGIDVDKPRNLAKSVTVE
ncbi:glutamine--fructose-6-phosphate transaminase (isomerizing) [Candidatus Cetobacterium colombiensis]|uniref:Glutamine--fructose-6-phosphate aminotransferase [isomerizing] n=1 Tax=Candidatus Cetobacterium colombiensis TaxID=3073100 RepID=A0ABU4W6L0_9FUSO|nr:glutamine--fructose-6-phosphate transaminase (isomerizing) [Candidatus Cetobacterium colombiensis]MDX8335163.1 glutamine--fructose-6-phosphate transaminase (isomerizing) [Candidatus Cetobacterium colombiensis]